MRIVARILLGIVVAGMTAWSAGAIYYSPLPGETLRAVLAGSFVIATAAYKAPFKFTGKIAKVTIELEEMKKAAADEAEQGHRQAALKRGLSD